MTKTSDERNKAVRRALDEARCQHPHGGWSKDESGRYWCTDCGEFIPESMLA
jgi:hypothetical protein